MGPLNLTDEQRHNLAADHTLTLDDGRTLKVTFGPDYDTQINDFDCYGKIAPVNRRNTWNAYGPAARPEGFDGAAEIIDRDWWWQPPLFDKADRRQWHTTPEYRRALRQTVSDLIRYGFQTVTLEVCQGTDAYGRDIVLDYAVTGGHEASLDATDVADILDDMIHLMDLTNGEEAA